MTARLTSPELSEAVSLLATQVYHRALRDLGKPEVTASATVETRTHGPVLRLELRLTVARPGGTGPGGGEPILLRAAN